jgi:hypothetical protein
MRGYLEHVADRRLAQLGLDPLYGAKNPLAFMNLQDVQELSNFFERCVSVCQTGVTGEVAFDADFQPGRRRETTVRSKEQRFYLERTLAPTGRLRFILCPWRR